MVVEVMLLGVAQKGLGGGHLGYLRLGKGDDECLVSGIIFFRLDE